MESLVTSAAASVSPQDLSTAVTNDVTWLHKEPPATAAWLASALLDETAASELKRLAYQVGQFNVAGSAGAANCDSTFDQQFTAVAGGLNAAPAAVQQDIAACLVTCNQSQAEGIAHHLAAQAASNTELVQKTQGVVGQMQATSSQTTWNWGCVLGAGRPARPLTEIGASTEEACSQALPSPQFVACLWRRCAGVA